MKQKLLLYIKKWQDIRRLIFRNVFLLVNVIIFSVVALLISFGDTREGVFLGIILILNTLVGIVRDIHAWTILEQLQLLTAVKITTVSKDGTEKLLLPEKIQSGTMIKLKLGDQIPCDGKLIAVHGLEVNEGIITGESNSFAKSDGEMVFAGSIVSSGHALLEATSSFSDSRIAHMTENIKEHSDNSSPIQHAISQIVKYSGYVLLAVIPFVIYRGVIHDESSVTIARSIGAIASMFVPQGLVVATTLMLAYGAIYSYRRHVLLQEVNATEKLGRIRNLCMDKTGTLTESTLTVDGMLVPEGKDIHEAENLARGYVDLSGDSSETIIAIQKFLTKPHTLQTSHILPFSSGRQYGAIALSGSHTGMILATGAPETFIEHLRNEEEKVWLRNLVTTNTSSGKRVICIVAYTGTELNSNLTDTSCDIVAVFVLHNSLREGVSKAINFFQNRGVSIYIISGDNPQTVQAIAKSAGVVVRGEVVTGIQMENWSDSEFDTKILEHSIYARIKPEQKEKIIEALKKNGFTAMVGDGANDALAIKKADLGIAMFDGAKATRQIASVILTRNSFSELPAGVKLADNIIENIEIFTTIFLNQIFLGYFLFIFVSLLGYTYPFTPLNITFINYFTIGIPSIFIFYWATHPKDSILPTSGQTFLRRVFLFPFISSVPQFMCISLIFVLTLQHSQRDHINTVMALTFIAIGIVFFLFTQSIHNNGKTSRKRKFQFTLLTTVEVAVLFFAFKSPFLTSVFNVRVPSSPVLIGITSIVLVCAIVQYVITKFFVKKSLTF